MFHLDLDLDPLRRIPVTRLVLIQCVLEPMPLVLPPLSQIPIPFYIVIFLILFHALNHYLMLNPSPFTIADLKVNVPYRTIISIITIFTIVFHVLSLHLSPTLSSKINIITDRLHQLLFIMIPFINLLMNPYIIPLKFLKILLFPSILFVLSSSLTPISLPFTITNNIMRPLLLIIPLITIVHTLLMGVHLVILSHLHLHVLPLLCMFDPLCAAILH